MARQLSLFPVLLKFTIHVACSALVPQFTGSFSKAEGVDRGIFQFEAKPDVSAEVTGQFKSVLPRDHAVGHVGGDRFRLADRCAMVIEDADANGSALRVGTYAQRCAIARHR